MKYWFTIVVCMLLLTLIIPLPAEGTGGPSSLLDHRTRQWIQQAVESNRQDNDGLICREDGWCYAVEYAMYLHYAARVEDRSLFKSLLEGLERWFLVRSPQDTHLDGSIAWRFRPDRDWEATGAAEMAGMMAGLYEAHQLWPDLKADRLIHLITQSFHQHQAEGFDGNWYICDYFQFCSRHFSTTGFLFNYHPDLFFRMGAFFEHEDMTILARRSLQALQDNQTPCGLFHLVYDPGISSHYGSSFHFSPNNLVKAADAAEIASLLAETDPARAQLTLDLFREHGFPVAHWFSVQDCLPIQAEHSGAGQLAVILRLSLMLGDQTYAANLAAEIESLIHRDFMNNPNYRTDSPYWTWDFTQILLALSFVNSIW